jgi:ABC-type sulfate transport system permease subunit
LRRLVEPDARAALKLTLFTVAIVVPVNAVFGLLMAWAVHAFRIPRQALLLSLIDLPFAVSPVVAGLCLVLLFGSQGWFAEILQRHDIKILFAPARHRAGDAVHHVPFVVRELIPLMQQQGADEETGGALARRGRMDDVPPRDPAQHQVGPAVRRVAVRGARDGRVRRGVGRAPGTSAA